MDEARVRELMTPQFLESVFPAQRSRDFFEAFYGDSEDSHFDIQLGFEEFRNSELRLSFELIQRPGKCLACNMTYGLPHVLERHPIINVKGIVQDIASALDTNSSRVKWTMGSTLTRSSELHTIPLIISFA